MSWADVTEKGIDMYKKIEQWKLSMSNGSIGNNKFGKGLTPPEQNALTGGLNGSMRTGQNPSAAFGG